MAAVNNLFLVSLHFDSHSFFNFVISYQIKGDLDGVKKLLDQGTSPNVADFAGRK